MTEKLPDPLKLGGIEFEIGTEHVFTGGRHMVKSGLMISDTGTLDLGDLEYLRDWIKDEVIPYLEGSK